MTIAHVSSGGLALIKKWEGLYLKAYKDPVGIWTIGYGSITNRRLGIIVDSSSVLSSEAVALDYMEREIIDFEDDMGRLIKVPLTQNQWDCLVSFIFNVGIGNFANSTLLKVLNNGRYKAVPTQLSRWNKARSRKTGKILTLQGLTNRRNDEIRMWNGEAVTNVAPPGHTPVSIPKEDLKPTINNAAVKQATTQSPTGKLAGMQILVGVATALKAGDPVVVALCGVIAVMGAYILYRKVRDLKEFVQ